MFVLLAFAANSVIIAKSVNAETLRSLLHADKLALLGALGVVLFTWLCDGSAPCPARRRSASAFPWGSC